MYIARIPNRNSKPAILLRESYREGGKVRTRTIANLTRWAPERIAAMERLVKGEFDDWSGELTSGEHAAAITPDDAVVALGRLTYLYTTDRNGQRHVHLPRPDDQQAKILGALGLSFPLKPKAGERAA